jgi:hypothetical protein
MADSLDGVIDSLAKLGVSTLQINMGDSWDGNYQIDAQQGLTDADNSTSTLRHWFQRRGIVEALTELKARAEQASALYAKKQA